MRNPLSHGRGSEKRGARRRGLTLLEVVLALGLITLMAGAMFAFYDVTLRSRDWGTRRITDGNLARVAAMKIAEEIRSANGFLPGAPGVSGKEHLITLQTVVLPDKDVFVRRKIQEDAPPARSDIRQVQYYLAYDPEASYEYPDGSINFAPLGLVRREIKTLNQAIVREDQQESVELELYAPEMKYLRFRYFDGVEWIDRWNVGDQGGLGNSLPQAVEVTVGYDPIPPPEEEEEELDLSNEDLLPALPEEYDPKKVTVVVRLPQADVFFGSRLLRASQLSSGDSGAEGGF